MIYYVSRKNVYRMVEDVDDVVVAYGCHQYKSKREW
jgi:hypothetical protein